MGVDDQAVAHTAANEFGAELGEPYRNGYDDGTPIAVEGVKYSTNADILGG